MTKDVTADRETIQGFYSEALTLTLTHQGELHRYCSSLYAMQCL